VTPSALPSTPAPQGRHIQFNPVVTTLGGGENLRLNLGNQDDEDPFLDSRGARAFAGRPRTFPSNPQVCYILFFFSFLFFFLIFNFFRLIHLMMMNTSTSMTLLPHHKAGDCLTIHHWSHCQSHQATGSCMQNTEQGWLEAKEAKVVLMSAISL
jgi:hypothetical protein